MKSFKSLTGIGLVTILLAFTTFQAQAKNFKSSDLLGFSQGQRDSFYSGVYMSIGHIAHMRDEAKGMCIFDWYFNQPKARIETIEATLKQFPDHSPTSVMIGLVQKDCGKFWD